MVEAGANEVSEAEILDALDIAHDAIKKLCGAQRELAEKVGKPKLEFEAPAARRPTCSSEIQASHGADLDAATQVFDKLERQDATKAVEAAVVEKYAGDPDADTYAEYKANAKVGVRQAREADHPRADRQGQEAS